MPFAVTEISPEARRAAQRVLASGWVTTGRETELFENDGRGTGQGAVGSPSTAPLAAMSRPRPEGF